MGADAAFIIENIAAIRKRISDACQRAGRNADEVKLLLATKTVPAERIRIAIECGENLTGENKVQELKEKNEVLRLLPADRHFIGHLQTNKIKDVLKYVSCIQSIDRKELAEKLNARLLFEKRKLDIMIQVNTSFESSKFGIHPDEALTLIRATSPLPQVTITGLMTIGLFDADPEKARPSFRLLREIRDSAVREGILAPTATELSMGMSGDLETAIEEGATIVRVGTAIFGRRQHPDSYYWNETSSQQ